MDEGEMIKRWVRHWKDAGPELEKIRERELREADNMAALDSLRGAISHAIRSQPMRTESGMVEMQRIFAKMRK